MLSLGSDFDGSLYGLAGVISMPSSRKSRGLVGARCEILEQRLFSTLLCYVVVCSDFDALYMVSR